jgi:hypothetical protein
MGEKMNSKDVLQELVLAKRWYELIEKYSPMEIVQILSFRDSLRVAYRLLHNHGWDENLQNYVIELVEAVRGVYPKEWNESWKYDAYLGMAYDIRYEQDKRYEAYKRAFDRANPPPRLFD